MGRKVVLGCTDLFFSMRIDQVARHGRAELIQVREDLPEVVERERPELVLVDLHAEGLHPLEAIAAIRSRDPELPIVAFARHGEVDLFQAAREAGASEVWARSAFTTRLPALLGAD